MDKGKHGFDGQKCAHASSKPLAIQAVCPAGFSSPGPISAPAKLRGNRNGPDLPLRQSMNQEAGGKNPSRRTKTPRNRLISRSFVF